MEAAAGSLTEAHARRSGEATLRDQRSRQRRTRGVDARVDRAEPRSGRLGTRRDRFAALGNPLWPRGHMDVDGDLRLQGRSAGAETGIQQADLQKVSRTANGAPAFGGQANAGVEAATLSGASVLA